MALRDRIGVDVGRRLRLEDAIVWAARNGVHIIDIELETGANALTGFDDRRCAAIRAVCATHGVRLGLHTLSAGHVADYSPYLGKAVHPHPIAYAPASAQPAAHM